MICEADVDASDLLFVGFNGCRLVSKVNWNGQNKVGDNIMCIKKSCC